MGKQPKDGEQLVLRIPSLANWVGQQQQFRQPLCRTAIQPTLQMAMQTLGVTLGSILQQATTIVGLFRKRSSADQNCPKQNSSVLSAARLIIPMGRQNTFRLQLSNALLVKSAGFAD